MSEEFYLITQEGVQMLADQLKLEKCKLELAIKQCLRKGSEEFIVVRGRTKRKKE